MTKRVKPHANIRRPVPIPEVAGVSCVLHVDDFVVLSLDVASAQSSEKYNDVSSGSVSTNERQK